MTDFEFKVNSFLKNKDKTIDGFVNILEGFGIKLIANDFDLTMLTLHSGGAVKSKSYKEAQVLKSLSKEWQSFSIECEKRKINQCVVTFADKKSASVGGIGGESLVNAVLEEYKINCIKNIYAYYPNLYKSESDYTALGLSSPMIRDKSFHLSLAMKDFNLKPHEIILIDDAKENCVAASKQGFFSILVENGKGFNLNSIVPLPFKPYVAPILRPLLESEINSLTLTSKLYVENKLVFIKGLDYPIIYYSYSESSEVLKHRNFFEKKAKFQVEDGDRTLSRNPSPVSKTSPSKKKNNIKDNDMFKRLSASDLLTQVANKRINRKGYSGLTSATETSTISDHAESFLINNCLECNLVLIGKVSSVMIESCHDCVINIGEVIGMIETINCTNLKIVSSCLSFLVDKSEAISLNPLISQNEIENDFKVLTSMSKGIEIRTPNLLLYNIPIDFVYEKGDGMRFRTIFNQKDDTFCTLKADLFGC